MSDKSKINYMDIKEFADMGILHEINRLFLHPLGLALEIEFDGHECKLSNIWDYRNDEEGILFGTLHEEKIKEFKEFREKQYEKRFKALGYVIQGPNDLDKKRK